MPITFVGNSKEERNRARSIAVGYLLDHPNVKYVDVYKRKWNYHKEKDEIVRAGTVHRENNKFWWMPWNDRSSGTYINKYGESMDAAWWYQVRDAEKKDLVTERSLTEARATAVRILAKSDVRNLDIFKGGTDKLGLVSKGRTRGYVWITYKNPRNPIAFDKLYVLYSDGRLGKEL